MDRYEEALEKARAGKSLEEIFPELKESEDERIRKWLIEEIKATHDYDSPTSRKCVDDALAYLEKQKENVEKEYVFRPLAGTDITIAAAQAIQKAQGGDRLVLAFNGMYIPVREYNTKKELVDAYHAYLEKQKELPTNEEMLRTLRVEYEKGVADTIAKYEQKEQKFTEKQDYSDLTDLERAIHRGFLVVGVENVPVTIIKETAQDCLAWMKPAEWSEKHIAGIFEKVGLAKIVREQGNDDLTNALQDAMLELSKVGNIEWSEEDEEMLEYIIGDVNDAKQLYTTKEAKDMADKEIAWLKSLPLNLKKKNEDVAKLCSNEWSEEDEEMLNRIIETLSLPPIYDTKACAKMVAWLKSLRPPFKDRDMKLKILKYLSTRCSSLEFEEVEDYLNNLCPSWKPSKEQMGMLLAVINDPNNAGAESCHLMLQSLYADLEKL